MYKINANLGKNEKTKQVLAKWHKMMETQFDFLNQYLLPTLKHATALNIGEISILASFQEYHFIHHAKYLGR